MSIFVAFSLLVECIFLLAKLYLLTFVCVCVCVCVGGGGGGSVVKKMTKPGRKESIYIYI